MATPLNQRLRDGIAAAQANQFDKARALLQPLVKSTPNDPLAWFWLAIASPSLGAAIPCLRRVLEIDADHAQARGALSKLLIAQAASFAAAGKRDEARGFAEEATRLTPDVDSAWLAVAAVSDRWPVRLESLRRAFSLNPLPATRTRLRQALLYQATMISTSDRVEGRELFRQAAELDPSDLRVWQALAQLADTPADALAASRELFNLAPDHPGGRTFLKKALAADARALDAAGDKVDARNRWRELLALDSRDVDALLGLAHTTTDENEAQRAIETAFEINPTHEGAAAAMARLQTSGLDPAAFETPDDPFARLDKSDEVFARLDATPDAFAQFELSDDPFARFEPKAAAPAPETPVAAAAPAPMPEPVEEAQPESVEVVTLELAEEPTPALVEEVTFELAEEATPALVEEVTLELTEDTTPALVEEVTLELTEEATPALVEEVTLELTEEATPAAVEETTPVVAAVFEPVATVEVARVDVAAADAAADAAPANAAAPVDAVDPVVVKADAVAAHVAPKVAAADADVQAQATAPETAVAPEESTRRKTVMIVDDSPTIRKILGLTLERAGYKIVPEPDGESALERLTQVVPDVILLDIAMPKIDGYEVCKRIKKDTRVAHVPVVMLSGKDALFDKVKGRMAGATEYLTKPFQTPAVLAAVAQACQPRAEVANG